jgi:hypothetical protein
VGPSASGQAFNLSHVRVPEKATSKAGRNKAPKDHGEASAVKVSWARRTSSSIGHGVVAATPIMGHSFWGKNIKSRV